MTVATKTAIFVALLVTQFHPGQMMAQQTSRYSHGASAGRMLGGAVTYRYPDGWKVERSGSGDEGTEFAALGDTRSRDAIFVVGHPKAPIDCSSDAAKRALHESLVSTTRQLRPAEYRNLNWRLAANDQVVYHQNGGNTLHRQYVDGRGLSWDMVTYCVGQTLVFVDISSFSPHVAAAFLDSIDLPKPPAAKAVTPTVASCGTNTSCITKFSSIIMGSVRR